MPAKDLIALMPANECSAASCAVPAPLLRVETGDWIAFLARPPLGQSHKRKAVLQMAQQRQFWLETLMQAGTVIPAMPGTRIAIGALDAMTACNAPLLQNLATRLKGRVQYQITLGCDLGAGLTHLTSQSASFAAARTTDELQSALEEYVRSSLQSISGAEVLALPVTGDMVANCALLLPQKADAKLDQVLGRIDDLWSAGFAIRQIGPSPAVSFASLGLKHVPLKQLRAAAQTLGLDTSAPLEAIRAARQSALRQPSAQHGRIKHAASVLEQSRALAQPAAFYRGFVWAEGQATSMDATQERAA